MDAQDVDQLHRLRRSSASCSTIGNRVEVPDDSADQGRRTRFPFNVLVAISAAISAAANRERRCSARSPARLKSRLLLLAGLLRDHCLFGIRRIARRQNALREVADALADAGAVMPLFLLPYLILPWMGANGWFEHGFGNRRDDQFDPTSPKLHSAAVADWGARAYWRAFGFILAWPLFIWNLFTDHPSLAGSCFVSADVRHHPADHLALGQGRLLRLDLLVRRARRNAG